jgi:hypothetical protein
MIGATVEIADFEEFKTPQIAWILLRTFVDDHEIARHAWKSSGLRPNIFQYCGFAGASIYEFLKLLCTTDQPPDITELRQMFPEYFKTLDRVDFRFDHVAPVARFLIDEARYLHNARALGLSDNIEVDDRSRRHVVERQIRNRIAIRIRALCSALLPYGGDFGEDWVALSRRLGSIAVRVKGSTIGCWHTSNADYSISSRSAVLLVQAIQNLNLSAALDWITNFFDSAGEAAAGPSAPLAPVAPQVVEVLPPERPVPAATIEAKSPTPAEITARSLAAWFALAKAGIPTFPVRLTWNSKKQKWDKPPAIDGWQQASTTDEEQIKAWYRDLPSALGIPAHHLVPGIWCGHPDLRLVVIDVDRHPGGADGVAAFQALVDANWLPIGPVTKTAGGGFHYIFRQPAGEPFGDTKGSLPDGVEVRGAGLIVAPGSIRPDGAMWRGRPSLGEAFPKGLVPELPDWIAALIRTSKPAKARAPKEEKPTPEAEPTPSAAPSGQRKASPETCANWTAAALTGNAAELAKALPGTRNNLTNALAYRMGRMVAPGWIAERTVIDAFLAASTSNSKIADDGGQEPILATIMSGLTAGKRKPLHDLPDHPWQPWRPLDGHDDNGWLLGFRSEIRALYRMRFPNNPGAVDAADERLIEIIQISADPWVIGREVRLLDVEYRRLADEPHGRRRGARLPAKMKPCDVSREVVDAYRQARKRAADKDRKAKKRAEEKALQDALDDLDDRVSVVLTFLRAAKAPQTTAQIMKAIKRKQAFDKLKGQSLRNAVLRLLEPSSPLHRLVIQTTGIAKNGKPTKLVAARREGDPATTTEAQL